MARLISVGCCCQALLLALSSSLASTTAMAEQPAAAGIPYVEFWSGIEATGETGFAYGGGVIAIGSDILSDGWRLRAEGGGGLYRYVAQTARGLEVVDIDVDGTTSTLSGLVGYQAHLDRAVTKVYVGIDHATHRLAPRDPTNAAQGTALGLRLIGESWLDLTDEIWGKLDGSYSTAFDTYAVTATAGYRLLPWLSAGGEAGALGNASYDAARLGAQLTADTSVGEVSLSAGGVGSHGHDVEAYVRLNYFTRY
jgi:hypothetical protein